MTDARDLAKLVLAKAQAAPDFLAFNGIVKTKPAKGYVSLFFGAGAPYPSSLVGNADRLRWSFRAICVGLGDDLGPDQCLLVATRFRARFLNWRPLGTGPWLVEAQDDAPLLRDDSVPNDVRFSLTLRYRLTT